MNNLPLDLNNALLAVIIMTISTFLTRLFSFALFSKKEPPIIFKYLGKYLPPMVMAILIIYSLKDIETFPQTQKIASIVAIGITAFVHLWQKNAMISIFGGTIIYMVLNNLL